MNFGRNNIFVLLLALALVVSLASPAAAQSDPAWADSLYDDFSGMTPVYNENAGTMDLGLANSLLENQRVTVRVTDGSETAYFWFDTDANKRITKTGQGKHPGRATLLIKTSRSTLSSISSSDTPVVSFRDAVREKQITFSGKTVGTFVIGIGVSIGQTLGLLG